MPVSSKEVRMVPSKRPMVGKFCTPEKPRFFSSRRNGSRMRKGSVPLTPARTGVCFTTGSTSAAISLTISLALPKARRPAAEPRPAMR